MKHITSPLQAGSKSKRVADLQDALQLLLEKALLFSNDKSNRDDYLKALATEREKESYGEVTAKLVAQFQSDRHLSAAGVDESTARALNELLNELGAFKQAPDGAKPYTIEGQIVLEDGRTAEQLKLRLYERRFGGRSRLLEETTTAAGGAFTFAYYPGDRPLSLEVRAVKGAGVSEREILLSKPLNDAEPRAVLKLTAPTELRRLNGEYRRLAQALTPTIGATNNLANAREGTKRQDVTLLSLATGWDARIIALAVVAETLAAEAKLSPEAVYGLLREGLPSDRSLLAQVNPEVVDKALRKAREARIIDLTAAQRSEFKEAFTKFSHKALLDSRVPGSDTTYRAMLEASGLKKDAQDKFGSVFSNILANRRNFGARHVMPESRNQKFAHCNFRASLPMSPATAVF